MRETEEERKRDRERQREKEKKKTFHKFRGKSLKKYKFSFVTAPVKFESNFYWFSPFLSGEKRESGSDF